MDRDFKGVWIPKEIWLDSKLSALEKFILAEIDSLDVEGKGCYASNQYLAEFCQCTERKVSDAVSKLIKNEYLEQVSFDGRHRILRSRVEKISMQGRKNFYAGWKKVPPINIEDNKEDIKNIPTVYKKEIQEVVDMYHEECPSLPKVRSLSDMRKKHINARLKEHSMDELRLAFQKAEASDWCTGRRGNWKCNLEWMMKSENNLLKILEGNYDNHDSNIERAKDSISRMTVGMSQEEIDEQRRLFG